MLSSNAALRPCVRLFSPRPFLRISTTRTTAVPFSSCIGPQRSQWHLRRLLGTGWNSLRGRRRVAPKRKTAKPTSLPGKASFKSKTTPSKPKTTALIAPKKGPVKTPSSRSSSTVAVRAHHNLPTYVAWCEQRMVDVTSNTYRGTHYEYTVMKALRKYNFFLEHRGGANDKGIDLLGEMKLPFGRGNLTALVQCKLSAPEPKVIRELDGACSGGPPAWKEEGVMAWLASPKPTTSDTWTAIEDSSRPTGFAQVDTEGRVIDLRWNTHADDAGLKGLEKRYFYVSRKNAAGEVGRPKQSVALEANDKKSRKSGKRSSSVKEDLAFVMHALLELIVMAAVLLVGAWLALFLIVSLVRLWDSFTGYDRIRGKQGSTAPHSKATESEQRQVEHVTRLLPNTWHEHDQALPEEEEQHRRGWWKCSNLGKRNLVSSGGNHHSGWFWSGSS